MITDYGALPAELKAAVDELLAQDCVIIASDFDGVLAPLVDNPSDSRMTEPSAAAIAKIAMHLSGSRHLALVSGRMLDQLFELASPPHGTHLIGSHGAEQGIVEGSELVRQAHTLSPQQAELLKLVTAQAEKLARSAPGSWIEHKPAAAVLHTRLAQRPDAQRINTSLMEFCQNLDVFAMAGKDVIEVAVEKATKGQALSALKAELGAAHTIYFGDDVTDETVFASQRDGDVSVKVGEGVTAAHFRVQNVTEISVLLSYIADKVIQDC